jgi:hypothetical protein
VVGISDSSEGVHGINGNGASSRASSGVGCTPCCARSRR